MIRGAGNTRFEAVLRLRVRGPVGAALDVDAVFDSGFNSFLVLPMAMVAALGLVSRRGGAAVLADGTIRRFAVYSAEVLWDDAWRPVLVSAVGDESLIGMRLVAGHRLLMDVVPGGAVEIAPLP